MRTTRRTHDGRPTAASEGHSWSSVSVSAADCAALGPPGRDSRYRLRSTTSTATGATTGQRTSGFSAPTAIRPGTLTGAGARADGDHRNELLPGLHTRATRRGGEVLRGHRRGHRLLRHQALRAAASLPPAALRALRDRHLALPAERQAPSAHAYRTSAGSTGRNQHRRHATTPRSAGQRPAALAAAAVDRRGPHRHLSLSGAGASTGQARTDTDQGSRRRTGEARPRSAQPSAGIASGAVRDRRSREVRRGAAQVPSGWAGP